MTTLRIVILFVALNSFNISALEKNSPESPFKINTDISFLRFTGFFNAGGNLNGFKGNLKNEFFENTKYNQSLIYQYGFEFRFTPFQNIGLLTGVSKEVIETSREFNCINEDDQSFGEAFIEGFFAGLIGGSSSSSSNNCESEVGPSLYKAISIPIAIVVRNIIGNKLNDAEGYMALGIKLSKYSFHKSQKFVSKYNLTNFTGYQPTTIFVKLGIYIFIYNFTIKNAK